jgi:transposase
MGVSATCFPAVTAAGNRLFVEAVLFRFRDVIPWRDMPERFGYGVAVHRRFSRRAEKRAGKGSSIIWPPMPATDTP